MSAVSQQSNPCIEHRITTQRTIFSGKRIALAIILFHDTISYSIPGLFFARFFARCFCSSHRRELLTLYQSFVERLLREKYTAGIRRKHWLW